MSRDRRAFLGSLRGVESALSLPIPARTRILRELEFDLEELTERFLAQGCSGDEARRRAEETLVPRGEALAALESLHEPVYGLLTRRLDPRRLRQMERFALASATAALVLLQGGALLRVDLFTDRSPFLLPVLGLGVAVVVVAVWKAFELWVKGDHRRPERGLGLLAGLSGLVGGGAVAGVVLDLYRLARVMEAGPADPTSVVLTWLIRDAVLLSVSILLVLTGVLAWFVLRHWVLLVQDEHRALLGASTASSSNHGV